MNESRKKIVDYSVDLFFNKVVEDFGLKYGDIPPEDDFTIERFKEVVLRFIERNK